MHTACSSRRVCPLDIEKRVVLCRHLCSKCSRLRRLHFASNSWSTSAFISFISSAIRACARSANSPLRLVGFERHHSLTRHLETDSAPAHLHAVDQFDDLRSLRNTRIVVCPCSRQLRPKQLLCQSTRKQPASLDHVVVARKASPNIVRCPTWGSRTPPASHCCSSPSSLTHPMRSNIA